MIYSLGEKKPKFNNEDVWIADSADLIGNVVLDADVSVWFNDLFVRIMISFTSNRAQIFKITQ